MLDPVGKRVVRQLMAELNRQGMTIITITHVMEEALDADRVVVIDAGGVVLDDRPAVVFAERGLLQNLGLDVPVVARLADILRSRIPDPTRPAVHGRRPGGSVGWEVRARPDEAGTPRRGRERGRRNSRPAT